jgi:hypothetical protein
LCERSRIAIGCPAKPRQIFKLDCRLDGRDCEIEVAKPLPSRGVVVAILDHGREQGLLTRFEWRWISHSSS